MKKIILIVDEYSVNNRPNLNLNNHGPKRFNDYEIITIKVENKKSTVNIINQDNGIKIQINENTKADVSYNNDDKVIILIDHPGIQRGQVGDIYVEKVIHNYIDITRCISRCTINNRYRLNDNCSISKIRQSLMCVVNYINNNEFEQLNSIFGL